MNAFLVAVALVAVAAFAGYRWYQERRTERITKWIQQFLSERYGSLPSPLSIQGTHDTHWPFLVAYRSRTDQARHRLQFVCPGARSTFALVSESRE